MICRTIAEVEAAADADAGNEPIRDQAWADRVAVILAPFSRNAEEAA